MRANPRRVFPTSFWRPPCCRTRMASMAARGAANATPTSTCQADRTMCPATGPAAAAAWAISQMASGDRFGSERPGRGWPGSTRAPPVRRQLPDRRQRARRHRCRLLPADLPAATLARSARLRWRTEHDYRELRIVPGRSLRGALARRPALPSDVGHRSPPVCHRTAPEPTQPSLPAHRAAFRSLQAFSETLRCGAMLISACGGEAGGQADRARDRLARCAPDPRVVRHLRFRAGRIQTGKGSLSEPSTTGTRAGDPWPLTSRAAGEPEQDGLF